MSSAGNTDLLTEFKKLIAVNKSQEAMLDEYSGIVKSKNLEIEMLQSMLSDATAHRSSMDNDTRELKDLQKYLNVIQQQSGASLHRNIATQQHFQAESAEQQLHQLQQDYVFLQLQLQDLQTQLLEINHRNLLLQQQNSTIAELESLLEGTRQEITTLSHFINHPK
ncbi:MAG: hypothetical protein ABIN94_18660 [Ferruginibacter sp.]